MAVLCLISASLQPELLSGTLRSNLDPFSDYDDADLNNVVGLKQLQPYRRGPSKPANLNKRLKRFRERGSSAMWVETGDAVTSAEKKRDMELRERVVREGGWRYEPHA